MEEYIVKRLAELDLESAKWYKEIENSDTVNIFAKQLKEKADLISKELKLVLAHK